MGELGRIAQGGDRLLHELEPLDRPKHDDLVPDPLDRDRPVRPGEDEPHPCDLMGKTGSAPLYPLRCAAGMLNGDHRSGQRKSGQVL
jgi:hypothetical protein